MSKFCSAIKKWKSILPVSFSGASHHFALFGWDATQSQIILNYLLKRVLLIFNKIKNLVTNQFAVFFDFWLGFEQLYEVEYYNLLIAFLEWNSILFAGNWYPPQDEVIDTKRDGPPPYSTRFLGKALNPLTGKEEQVFWPRLFSRGWWMGAAQITLLIYLVLWFGSFIWLDREVPLNEYATWWGMVFGLFLYPHNPENYKNIFHINGYPITMKIVAGFTMLAWVVTVPGMGFIK